MEIKNVKIATARKGHDISDDVIDRLAGLQDFTPEEFLSGTVIFYPETIRQIMDDEDDNTNETTKLKIQNLYEKIKDCQYLIIC